MTSNIIRQVIRLRSLCCPLQINGIIDRSVTGQNTHAVIGILHLPNPPDSIDHAVVEIENGVTWRGEEVLFEEC